MSEAPILVDNSLRVDVCPLCGSNSIGEIGLIDYEIAPQFGTIAITLTQQPTLWRCGNCDSGFTQNAVPASEACRLYSHGDSSRRWPNHPLGEQKTAEFVAVVEKYGQNGSRVLDVGCSDGALLEFASRQGCYAFGVDLSAAARREAKSRGFQVFPSLDDAHSEAPYDTIFASDVVEHLYDVPAFMNACHSLLVPSGKFVCLTGDISSFSARITGSRWWYVNYPEHVRFPSPKFLRSRPGFRVVEVRTTLASNAHRYPFLRAVRDIAQLLVRGTYRGIPAVGPDHMILVLEKT